MIKIVSGIGVAKKIVRKAGRKIAKARPKTKHKIKAVVKRKVKTTRHLLPRSLEDVMISRFALPNNKEGSGILAELLYNLTPSTRGLGYGSGFHVGVRLSELHNLTNSIHPLINALNNAGFSNVLYYPHKQTAVIEALHHQDCNMPLNSTLHIFEAGVIAGYLSHSTGTHMSVQEVSCAHGPHQKCQFAIEQQTEINYPDAFEGTTQIESSIKESALAKRPGVISSSYFSLLLTPLTKNPLRQELSKLLFIVGQRFGTDPMLIENLSHIFLAHRVVVQKRGKVLKSIQIEFFKESSSKAYLDLVLPFFSGILFSEQRKLPKVSTSLTKSGNYLAELAAK